jgi:hypothetical protein
MSSVFSNQFGLGQEMNYIGVAWGGHSMELDPPRPSAQSSRLTRIAWILASVVFLFTAENIWIDPWLRSKSHRIPSLVPEGLSGAWFLAFTVCGVALILLILCLILMIRDRHLPVSAKIGTALAVFVVLLLSAQWLRVTNGQPSLFQLPASGKKHSVTLTWKASVSQVAGYNVYRRKAPATEYKKINSSLVQGLSYTDNNVASGATYYYVTRSVDAQGHESVNSVEFSVVIP